MGQYTLVLNTAQKFAVQGEYREALKLIQGVLDEGDLNDKERCNANFFMCRLYSNYALGNLDSSLYYLQKATKIAEEIKSDTLMAGCYERLGVLYENRSQRMTSLKYYQKSAALYQKMKHEQGMAIIYSNMGIHHAVQGNYVKSNQYFQQAIPIIKKIKNVRKKTAYLSSTYNSLGSNAWEVGAYEESLNYYHKVSKLRPQIYPPGHSLIILDQVNIASTYYKLGMVDSAFYQLNIGIEQASETAKASLAFLHREYASIYLDQKKYKLASEHAYKSLEYYRSVYGSPHQIKIAQVYNLLSSIALEQKQYESALEHTQKALIANSYSFENPSLQENPLASEVLALDIELMSLAQKGAIYYQWYQDTRQPQLLKKGWTHLKLAVQLVDTIRLEYYNDYPLLVLRKDVQEVYQWALSCLYELEQLQPNQFLSQTFKVMEQSKAYALLAEIQQHQNVQSAEDLPPLLYKWNELVENIAFFKSQLLEQQRLEINNEAIKKLEKKCFQLGQDQDQLLAEIKQQMPMYYQQYFGVHHPTLEDVQRNLEEKEAILIYASGKEHLLVLKVTTEEVMLTKLDTRATIQEEVKRFRKSILDKEDRIYLEKGYTLYEQLLKGLSLADNIQKINLITDATLQHLAFDALLTKKVEHNGFPNYQRLPYFIKQYQLTYQYSASQAFIQVHKKIKKGIHLAAFAPVFKPIKTGGAIAERNEKLVNLPGSKREVDKISTYFPSTIFMKEQASKMNFLVQIETANLVHLATHGLLNNEEPAYSAIAFAQKNGAVDLFYAHELYGKELDLELLTLSACNSGMGKLQTGEGMMSLARSFALAGCPSVVMSFWEIADQSAPFIFPEFYNQLSEGSAKDFALQQAKLAYIKQSDANGAHPYYWAGIALIGDTAAVSEKSFTIVWIIVGGLGTLILGLVFIRKKKNTKT